MFCWVEECEEIGKELDWSSLEISLVQILVIVVITNLRIIWTEVENGFKRREFRFEWVDPKRLIKHYKKWELLKLNLCNSLNRKGIGLKLPNLVGAFMQVRVLWDIIFGNKRKDKY